MKWIKIDDPSTPKDGDDILCYDGNKQIVCHWSDYEDDGSSWCTHAFGRQKGWNDFNNEIHFPTHWMPLPNPPEKENEYDNILQNALDEGNKRMVENTWMPLRENTKDGGE